VADEERAGVRVLIWNFRFQISDPKDPHPDPLPEYREREKKLPKDVTDVT
jgi:hypothetical protein